MPSIALSSPSLRLPPSLLSSPFLPSPLLPSCFLSSPLSSHFHAVQQKPQGDFKKTLLPVLSYHHQAAICRWADLCGLCGFSGFHKDLPRVTVLSMTDCTHYCKEKCHLSTLKVCFFSSIIPALFYVLACRGYRPIFSIQAWRMTSWGEQLPSPFSQELIGTICSLWNDLPLISFCFCFFSLFPLSSRLKAKEPNNRIKDCLFI